MNYSPTLAPHRTNFPDSESCTKKRTDDHCIIFLDCRQYFLVDKYHRSVNTDTTDFLFNIGLSVKLVFKNLWFDTPTFL